jgi:hypothetical protein
VSDVFISYDRESRELAEALVEDIKALGYDAWLDRELTGGHPWWNRILDEIRASKVFVYVLTPRSLDSDACQREHSYAAALGKTVLPILAAEGVSTNLLPPALAQLQFVDYRSRDRAAAFRLGRAFGAVPPPVPLPNPLPAAPEAPISYLGGVAHRLAGTPVLSQEEQSVLLIDLKGRLRDPETAEDARSLLKQFRRRPELLASIAFEIDEVLGAAKPPARQSPAPQYPSPQPEYPLPMRPEPDEDAPPPRAPGPTQRERLYGGLVGAVLGSVVGAVALVANSESTHRALRSDFLVFALMSGIGGAVAGVIGGIRRRAARFTLVGALVGWIALSLLDLRESDAFAVGGVFGAPVGAILGSVAGVIYLTRKR